MPKTIRDHSAVNQENIRIGAQIRDLRKSKSITVAQMAKQINKSVGYISQVERGISSLPIPLLQLISELLDVQVTWFFHTSAVTKHNEIEFIVRSDSRRKLSFSGSGISEELLSPRLSGDLLMILTTFSPEAQSDKTPRKRKAEEAGFVQYGTLELTISSQKFTLHQGDSFSLKGTESHFIQNPSKEHEAIVIWTIASGNY